MARRPARKSAPRASRPPSAAAPTAPTTDREKIVAAFLALLADERFELIGLADVAGQAGVSLAQLRDEFPSTLAILAAHIKATDRAVLAADVSDMAEEPERERLFDVLMRRLEILAPLATPCARCCARPAATRRLRSRSMVSWCARSNGC